MGDQRQGALAGALLLVAAGISGLPQDMIGLGIVLVSALLLDRFAVALSRNIRFSPALPVVLGGALDPQVGAGVALLYLVISGLADLKAPFLSLSLIHISEPTRPY